ncbi:MAG: hypothetical protein D6706_01510, partial [Chloroflexi bacterium]
SVEITFDTVDTGGVTSVNVSKSGPLPPSGFTIIPADTARYFHIQTTAAIKGPILVCFHYQDSWVRGYEYKLRLLHYDSLSSSWQNITNTPQYPDTLKNVICGQVTSLSPFALAEPCCIGASGNVNADPEDATDVADLTLLVDHLFISFAALPCPDEANINGDPGGTVDISDLTALIDHLFISFTPTAPCQ